MDGQRYRVLDCTMRNGALVFANPPAPWATSRVFRPATGYRRLYRFVKGESRDPTPDALARQLRGADYMATMPPGAADVDPR